MANNKAEASMSAFTSNGEVFAHLNPKGVLKVWNTSDGTLLSEWKHPSKHDGVQYTRITCSFVGKKRRKENSTCLVAYATNESDIYTISATDATMKWKLSRTEFGEIATLSFTNKGRKLCVISTDGTLCEMNSETGEILKEISIPKKYISTLAYIFDDKILAASDGHIRVLSLEDGDVLAKFSSAVGPVLHLSSLEDTNIIITSTSSENLSVQMNESGNKKATDGPVLLMKDRPLTIDCKSGSSGSNGENLFVLSVSDSGIAYVWNMKTKSQVNISPTKVKVEAHNSILAARLISINGDDQAVIHIVYGSLSSPRFALVDVATLGEDIVVDSSGGIQENRVNDEKDQKARGKKRAASDADSETAVVNHDNGDPNIGIQMDDHEPTIGEKLASLNIINNKEEIEEKAETSPAKPPSADSVHVLLKQALHADDRSLLLDCLFRQNEKVITNSVSVLNPSDVFKLLECLISMIQSRGAIVACTLPWLKSLLLQHASSIMSQESSLIALNSLYQLIESRISTFDSAVQLSSSLDLLYTKTIEDGVDEAEEPLEPIIFEDFSDDEDQSEEDGDAMETDEEDNEQLEAVSNVSDDDPQAIDGMVDY
ncbi:putative transcription factor WD40-like family [Helianthus annuus]|uniref:Transcription factor WD40-like family n=2 Tax=Helianthus annuus TaxID=4232 RepID=A0A9K3NQF4_HELAN|nr:WD repeat-containing protein 43 [Helianthus annuus]KAF5808115.1 putative transcription factor WD40-like family [Helianthus annuus]KAJ0595298.1 putative transcription factor WD40-like family [Helianthus annuus]KAJ0755981.1 putative transcription factor WD40-like family [Helianthus annuus]KAJ0759764.1 putative transcription factor WD40-like family [Helianthus annuus]KAJ0924869.1 putative transcription factor WD40-like family [Helianthus annuus]